MLIYIISDSCYTDGHYANLHYDRFHYVKHNFKSYFECCCADCYFGDVAVLSVIMLSTLIIPVIVTRLSVNMSVAMLIFVRLSVTSADLLTITVLFVVVLLLYYVIVRLKNATFEHFLLSRLGDPLHVLGVYVAVDVELVRILGVFRSVRVPLAPDLHVKL